MTKISQFFGACSIKYRATEPAPTMTIFRLYKVKNPDSSITFTLLYPQEFDVSSVIRRFLLWWFDVPFSPWVCGNIVVDVTNTKKFLQRINQNTDHHVTLQHIIAKSVSHHLQKVPEANARIIGNKIQLSPT